MIDGFLNLDKGKGEAYHCLKLTDLVMRLLEQVLHFYIYKIKNIDQMPYEFVPDRGTTDVILFIAAG